MSMSGCREQEAITVLYLENKQEITIRNNHDKFWAECASTVAKLDDILAYNSGTPASFFEDGKEPGYADFLHRFGEHGVVAKGGKKKNKAKLENCGDIYFFRRIC